MTKRVLLKGSERRPVANAVAVSSPDPNQIVDVTILVRRRAPLPALSGGLVKREDFAGLYGGLPGDARLVEDFAGQNDLTVREVDFARRSVVLSGTLANVAEAFGIDFDDLMLYQSPDGDRFRGRTGALYVPEQLDGIILGVFGIDNRSQARARICRRRNERHGGAGPGDTQYIPGTVASLYDFPPGTTGAGQTVAIIELGGGFRIFDENTYFADLGITPLPAISSVSVDGWINFATGDPGGNDGEVMLDMEVVGSVAPGARMVVYFSDDDDRAFFDALAVAVHDQLRAPSVISISWGHAESEWTAQAINAFNELLQEAALFGVTVCVASGDNGSLDNAKDNKPHVDFPAASPWALACGGTRLESAEGAIQREVVWNNWIGSSGGGVSEIFPLPDYQNSAGVPLTDAGFKGRGVPDVAGDADPTTGYEFIVDGRNVVIGGTSAVAPLWAALIARINEAVKQPVGFANPKLYNNPGAFHDITEGSNGAYQAHKGWDACTGLGSPIGTAILKALSQP
ncbi:MAG: S53 family peptidase [Bryobacteraceae bacterium]|jgi:kumamolisin